MREAKDDERYICLARVRALFIDISRIPLDFGRASSYGPWWRSHFKTHDSRGILSEGHVFDWCTGNERTLVKSCCTVEGKRMGGGEVCFGAGGRRRITWSFFKLSYQDQLQWMCLDKHVMSNSYIL
jgi:hypothetical protein